MRETATTVRRATIVKRVSRDSVQSRFHSALSWPLHQPGNISDHRWVIGKHHRQILSPKSPFSLAFHLHFDWTSAGAIDAGDFPFRAIRPIDPHGDAHF